jgi:6-methylsalicylate decarboxylase
MSSTGWLDIHGHFGLPLSPDEAAQQVQAFCKAHFLISEPWTYNVDKVLAYLYRANISM